MFGKGRHLYLPLNLVTVSYTHTHTHTHTTTGVPGLGGSPPATAMSSFVAATAIPFIQPFQDEDEEDVAVSLAEGKMNGRAITS